MKLKMTLMFIVFTTIMFAQNDSTKIEYMRSSLATFLLDNVKLDEDAFVKDAFISKFAPDKYNNHELENRIIPNETSLKSKDLVNYLEGYLKTNNIAKKLIAKWFNRSEKGGFDTKLVSARGLYNSQELDKQIAKSTIAGESRLIDKGEDLIDNTFVIIMVSNYTKKEEVANGIKFGMNLLQSSGLMNTSLTTELVKGGVGVLGKGYWVGTKSYLFKLVWDEETRHRFYNELWTEDDNIDLQKVKDFDNSDFFKLEYIGETKTGADIQSSIFSAKTNGQLIERATIKSFDKAINNLQTEYDVFSLKLPIYTVEPTITIKAGTKEGITNKTKFGVFEKQENKKREIELVQVGKLKVDNDYPIWNNEYGANEENPDQKVDRTVLKIVKMKGDLVPGMLIIQTN